MLRHINIHDQTIVIGGLLSDVSRN